MTLPPFVPFLESRLRPITTADFIEKVTDFAKKRPEKEQWRISYLNAHCSNLTARNPKYRQWMNTMDILYADGQAVVWASRLLGHPVPERVNAGDFIEDFCRVCAAKGLRLFLVGGRPNVAREAATRWREKAPGLEIAGTHHGFFSPDEEPGIADMTNRARADIVLLGLSAPRQEGFAMGQGPNMEAPVVWCVGALFEYFSRERKRAPVWMRRAGLEWLFRLVLEPKRLWRRYLLGNGVFVWRVLRARLLGRKPRGEQPDKQSE